jgi:hypothetical protein
MRKDDTRPSDLTDDDILVYQTKKRSADMLPPIPERDERWSYAARKVCQYLDRIEEACIMIADINATVEDDQRGMLSHLKHYPTLYAAYRAFIGAKAGRTGAEFAAWLEAHGGLKSKQAPGRHLKVVVDNTEPKMPRVRLNRTPRVRLKPSRRHNRSERKPE